VAGAGREGVRVHYREAAGYDILCESVPNFSASSAVKKDVTCKRCRKILDR
jgi:hypothetical protein